LHIAAGARDHFPRQNSPTGHSNGINRFDAKHTKQNEYILGDPKKIDLNLFRKIETKI
jgi:hypothetical protein